MENLTNLQLFEISRLLDERYFYLRMRLRRLAVIATNHPEWCEDIEKELVVIDSISKIL